MPIVAIPAAAVAIGIAGYGVATVGLTVATAFAITAAVGATVSAIGSVTGDRTLTMIGAGVGAVGGIGALATSAGLFGTAAAGGMFDAAGGAGPAFLGGESSLGAAAGGAAETAGAIGSSLGAADPAMAGMVSPDTFMAGGQTDIFNEIAAQMNVPGVFDGGEGGAFAGGDTLPGNADIMASSADVTPAVATDTGVGGMDGTDPTSLGGTDDPIDIPATGRAQGGGLIDQGGQTPPIDSTAPATGQPTPAVAAPTGAPRPVMAPVNPAPSAPVGQVAPGAPDASGFPTARPATWYDAGLPGSGAVAQRAAAGVGGVPANPDSTWATIMGMIGKPGVGTLLSGAIQAGGAFIAGATSSLTPAQVAALNAQAESNHAAANFHTEQANMLRLQQANMSGPMSVAHRVPRVTGAPAPTAPTGLINTPPRAPTVTGAPAA